MLKDGTHCTLFWLCKHPPPIEPYMNLEARMNITFGQDKSRKISESGEWSNNFETVFLDIVFVQKCVQYTPSDSEKNLV
jgi:hypothetical protein